MSSITSLDFLILSLYRAMQDLRQTCISAFETFLTLPSFIRSLFRNSLHTHSEHPLSSQRDLEDFLQEVEEQFSSHLTTPSFNHTLPSGNESGRYLALDVGGSTLRVALVDLLGRKFAKANGELPMQIVRMRSWRIDEKIKQLEGTLFFDWIAEKMEHMLSDGELAYEGWLEAGLSWSFPVE